MKSGLKTWLPKKNNSLLRKPRSLKSSLSRSRQVGKSSVKRWIRQRLNYGKNLNRLRTKAETLLSRRDNSNNDRLNLMKSRLKSCTWTISFKNKSNDLICKKRHLTDGLIPSKSRAKTTSLIPKKLAFSKLIKKESRMRCENWEVHWMRRKLR